MKRWFSFSLAKGLGEQPGLQQQSGGQLDPWGNLILGGRYCNKEGLFLEL